MVSIPFPMATGWVTIPVGTSDGRNLLHVWTEGPSGGDTIMELFNGQGRYVGYDDDDGEGYYSSLFVYIPTGVQTETLYVVVSNYNISSWGNPITVSMWLEPISELPTLSVEEHRTSDTDVLCRKGFRAETEGFIEFALKARRIVLAKEPVQVVKLEINPLDNIKK